MPSTDMASGSAPRASSRAALLSRPASSARCRPVMPCARACTSACLRTARLSFPGTGMPAGSGTRYTALAAAVKCSLLESLSGLQRGWQHL